jgi:hypothetical protein
VRASIEALERPAHGPSVAAGPCRACGADDRRPRVVVTPTEPDAGNPPGPTPADSALCPRCRREPMHVVIWHVATGPTCPVGFWFPGGPVSGERNGSGVAGGGTAGHGAAAVRPGGGLSGGAPRGSQPLSGTRYTPGRSGSGYGRPTCASAARSRSSSATG